VKIKAGPFESTEWDLQFPPPQACLPGARVKCVCPTQPPSIGPPCPEDDLPTRWLIVLGIVAVLAVGGVVIVTLVRRKGEIVELPDLSDQIAVAPAAAPPVGAARIAEPERQTQMLRRLDDDDDGMPNVAWIVPLSGPVAYQTFRLSHRTTIGAGKDCDVRIGDPSMSAMHAEILFSEGGYVLFDLKSRNGITFYDKPITKHTLIDNDLFTCGTTPFKFKTTLN
jgi:hypothetical protein